MSNSKIEEHIKLALYGADCTQEYAEEQTKALLKIIDENHTKTEFEASDHWYFFCSVLGAGLFIIPDRSEIGNILVAIYFGIGITLGNVWYHYSRKTFTWLHSKWKK